MLYQLQLDKEKRSTGSNSPKLMKNENDIDTANVKKADEDTMLGMDPEQMKTIKKVKNHLSKFTKFLTIFKLEQRLEQKIKEFTNGKDDQGVFVKLSTRSPKDAAFVGDKMKSIIKVRNLSRGLFQPIFQFPKNL